MDAAKKKRRAADFLISKAAFFLDDNRYQPSDFLSSSN